MRRAEKMAWPDLHLFLYGFPFYALWLLFFFFLSSVCVASSSWEIFVRFVSRVIVFTGRLGIVDLMLIFKFQVSILKCKIFTDLLFFFVCFRAA